MTQDSLNESLKYLDMRRDIADKFHPQQARYKETLISSLHHWEKLMKEHPHTDHDIPKQQIKAIKKELKELYETF